MLAFRTAGPHTTDIRTRSLIVTLFGAVFCLLTLQSCNRADRTRKAAFDRGQQFYKQGQYDDAEIQFRRVLQIDPHSGEAQLWLGRTEERRGKYPEALSLLKEAVALSPSDDAPRIDLANFMLVAYLGNSSRSPAIYREISQISGELLARNPRSFDGIRLKGYLALSDKRPSEAAVSFMEANRIRRNDPDVITALVESLALDGKDSKAEQVALDFLRDKPDYGPLYTILYQEYWKAGRRSEAESILKSKVAHNPREGLYRIELARHYARAGKNREMTEVISQVSEDPENFPHGHLDVGDFYVESRNWEGARRQYERGLQTDPKSRLIYLKRLVSTDFSVNDRIAARRDLELVLKDQPRDPDARASRASLRMASDDAREKQLAVSEFKALLDESPANQAVRIQYAAALRATGSTEAARQQYRLVAQQQPGNQVALQALADLSIRGEHIDDALKYANQILAMDPGSVPAALVKSAALASRGLFAETRAILRPLVNSHPELREAQLQLALLDVEEQHFEDAEKRFRKYYRPGTGDFRSLEGIVALYRARNRTDEAIALMEDDLRKGPPSDPVRALLARTAAESGRNELATETYEQLADSQPQSPEIAVEAGLAWQAKGNLLRAIAEFDRALKLAPGNSLVYAYLGKALDDAGRKSDALRIYRQGLVLDPTNPWLGNNLAFLLAETGKDLDEALKLAHQAVQLAPGNSSFSDTLGWVYLKKKDFSSAIHIFESVREKTPGDAEFRIHLSQALLAAGDRTRCRSELKAAMQLPRTPEQQEKMKQILKEADSTGTL